MKSKRGQSGLARRPAHTCPPSSHTPRLCDHKMVAITWPDTSARLHTPRPGVGTPLALPHLRKPPRSSGLFLCRFENLPPKLAATRLQHLTRRSPRFPPGPPAQASPSPAWRLAGTCPPRAWTTDPSCERTAHPPAEAASSPEHTAPPHRTGPHGGADPASGPRAAPLAGT